ncbi:MAG: hypothetical protein EOM46_07090 [Gammaproteobacteria bacterium]|nr:hypothetical protein [Gammaproteobacteria bacterium]
MEVLVYIGIGIFIIGGIGTLIAAFKESLLWGLGCLLFTPISLVFLVLHWQKAKNPFFLQLVGLAVVLLGAGMKV